MLEEDINMPQVINEKGIGQVLGENLGTGLSQGLQGLANLRMNQLSQRQQVNQASQFWQGLGLPQNLAHQFASAPEVVQKSLLDRLEGLNLGGQQQQQMQPQQSNMLSQFSSPALLTPEAQEVLGLGKQPQQLGGQQTQQGGLKIGANPVERRHKETLAQQDKLFQAKQKLQTQHEVNKETKPLYDEINKEYKSVKGNDLRLNRIEELNNKGNLGLPIFNSALDTISKGVFGFGINLKNLMTKDAQELEKLSTDFIKGAKDIFGSRITDVDLKTFLQTIPSLYQSKEGRAAVINNMRLFNEAAVIKKKAMDKIIEANDGKRPYNLDVLIDQASEEPLGKLAEKFTMGVPKEDTSVATRIGQGLGLVY